jgi:hypothetical protein
VFIALEEVLEVVVQPIGKGPPNSCCKSPHSTTGNVGSAFMLSKRVAWSSASSVDVTPSTSAVVEVHDSRRGPEESFQRRVQKKGTIHCYR